MSRKPGRPAGETGTRAAIVEAARAHFAAHGYDRTTLRGVAAAAGVDPALVLHYFGSKQRLFLSAVELPVDAATVGPVIVAGDRDRVGERFAQIVLSALEEPAARERITAMVRAAASEPAAAELMRELVSERVLGPIAEALGVDDAPLRASLVGSQVVGLVMARYVVGVEPLASLPVERVAAAVAPNLQRYLVEPLNADD